MKIEGTPWGRGEVERLEVERKRIEDVKIESGEIHVPRNSDLLPWTTNLTFMYSLHRWRGFSRHVSRTCLHCNSASECVRSRRYRAHCLSLLQLEQCSDGCAWKEGRFGVRRREHCERKENRQGLEEETRIELWGEALAAGHIHTLKDVKHMY